MRVPVHAAGAAPNIGAGGAPPTLLCVANFPANTGFAWNYIERLYADLANHFAARGVRTLVAYPEIGAFPKPLRGSAAIPAVLPLRSSPPHEALNLALWMRRHRVRVLYLADWPALAPAYLPWRLAGVRQIVVHDHASGEQQAPQGLKWAAKWVAARTPGITADRVVAVSDYVATRQRRVGLVPPTRVVRIHNCVEVPPLREASDRARLQRVLGLSVDRPIVACAGRCTREKGIAHLLRAFDRAALAWPPDRPRPLLVYIGDGPALPELRRLRETLASSASIVLAGYRANAAELLGGADLCVVPSLWAEAFGLAVVEPMARGRPVIASRVGGIPELIEDGVSGMLVPPGDEVKLAHAISVALADLDRMRAMGRVARRWVEARLGRPEMMERLLPQLEAGFEKRRR